MRVARFMRAPTAWVVLGMLVLSVLVFGWLPDRVPTHFDRWGRPDGWMPRELAVLLMPGVFLMVLGTIRILDRFSPRGYELAPSEESVQGMMTATGLFLGLLHGVILLGGLGFSMAVHRVVPVGVGLLIAAIGLYLPGLKRNWWVGVRTPWSLSSTEAWNRTHRLVGPLWVVGGLLLAFTGPVAAIVPGLWFGALILMSVTSVVISYRVSA